MITELVKKPIVIVCRLILILLQQKQRVVLQHQLTIIFYVDNVPIK
jgi:hypothetical protein